MLTNSPSITSRSIPRRTSLMPALSWKHFLICWSRIMADWVCRQWSFANNAARFTKHDSGLQRFNGSTTSFVPQGHHRIDFGRLPSREVACDHGCPNQERRGHGKRDWVYRWQPVELRGNKALSGENSRDPDDQTASEHNECLP